MDRDTREAIMNQVMALRPTRPIEPLPDMLATPVTKVASTKGAITILIRRKNTSVTRFRYPEISFAAAASS
ncbi:hypothetical protein D3C85_1628750 [compost metagenome]